MKLESGGVAGRFVRVRRIRSVRELQRALAIRMRVFVKEQRVPAEIEVDRDDQRAIHLLATLSGKPVGTARIVVFRGNAKIGCYQKVSEKGYWHKVIAARRQDCNQIRRQAGLSACTSSCH
jgi:predicted GNAT family N-acyltransferase